MGIRVEHHTKRDDNPSKEMRMQIFEKDKNIHRVQELFVEVLLRPYRREW